MQAFEGCTGLPVPSLMHRRRVMEKPITYVGLDVHKDTIAIALAESGKRGEVREHGKIANTPAALKLLAARLARNGHELRFCYEAGPCGYGVQRQLSAAGHGCVVVAPSLIPHKPGERIKTDRRDAINLAKLHRAGELTAVWVPDQAHEAIRDLVRARLAAVRTLRQGGMTKAGNGAARRVLVEAAWSYRFSARISREQLLRQESLAKPIRDIAWNGTGTAVPAVSQACPGRKAANHRHRRSRARAGWLRLGARKTDACDQRLIRVTSPHTKPRRPHSTKTHPKLSKAGGTITVRRTLASTTSRISSDAGSQTEEVPRRITGPAVTNPRIRA
jgi:hypothetical protein